MAALCFACSSQKCLRCQGIRLLPSTTSKSQLVHTMTSPTPQRAALSSSLVTRNNSHPDPRNSPSHIQALRAASRDAAQEMPNAKNQRRKSNASSLSGTSATAAGRTRKGRKKEGPFGHAAVNAAISDIASVPTSSDYNTSDLELGPVKWDSNTDFEDGFLITGQTPFPPQSGLNPSSPSTTTMTATTSGTMFEYMPGSSLFTSAETNPFSNSQVNIFSDMNSQFRSDALPKNLFESTSSTTIGGTPGQPTTNNMEETTPNESTLPPVFASPEELDFVLKPRAALRHYGSVYLSGKSIGPRRSASFPKAFHSKMKSKPRPVTAPGPMQVTPALSQSNQQQQQQTQEQEQSQSWSLLNENAKQPLNTTTTANLPPVSTFTSSSDQKTSPEWLSMIHTELRSLTQHIKISGTGQQAKLHEIAALLVEIRKQQKRDSEALTKALQIKEDQNKKGLEGFVDDSLKFMVQVVRVYFLPLRRQSRIV